MQSVVPPQEVSGLSLDKNTSAGLLSLATGCKLEPFSLGSGYFAVDGNLPSETILP